MGRLTDLADAFREAGLPDFAVRLASLQPALDRVQQPSKSASHDTRESLKATERQVLKQLKIIFEAANDGPGWAPAQLGRLLGILEFEAEMRDAAWLGRELLASWDQNANGIWEPPEIQAYQLEVARLREVADRDAFMPRWYFMAEDNVYGPLPLTKATSERELPNWLVRFGKDSGWVRLGDIIS